MRFSFPDRLNIRGWDFQETLFSEHSDRPFSIVQIQSLAGACAEGFSEHGQNPHSAKRRPQDLATLALANLVRLAILSV
jgi:hypothetical protein